MASGIPHPGERGGHRQPGGSGTPGAGGGRSSPPESRVMGRVLRVSSSPATPRARGREPGGRANGPAPPRSAPPPRAGEPRWCTPASCAPPSEAPARGCCRGRRRRRGGGARSGRRRGAKVRTGTRRAGAARGAGPRSPSAVTLLPSLRPRRRELGGTGRRLAAAGWMRDLRGPRGGRQLSTRGSRTRWPWPPTLTT